MSSNCPKCQADISDTYEGADPDVGISAGYYCDTCDLGVAEWEVGGREVFDDDVMPAPTIDHSEPLGTEFKTPMSGRPGHPGFAEFKRIAKSWGYD